MTHEHKAAFLWDDNGNNSRRISQNLAVDGSLVQQLTVGSCERDFKFTAEEKQDAWNHPRALMSKGPSRRFLQRFCDQQIHLFGRKQRRGSWALNSTAGAITWFRCRLKRSVDIGDCPASVSRLTQQTNKHRARHSDRLRASPASPPVETTKISAKRSAPQHTLLISSRVRRT